MRLKWGVRESPVQLVFKSLSRVVKLDMMPSGYCAFLSLSLSHNLIFLPQRSVSCKRLHLFGLNFPSQRALLLTRAGKAGTLWGKAGCLLF